jgi:O-acetyl-ADP-ribose deacetylase (regulator of RNase III)
MPGKVIRCIRGDITDSSADAIVNAANNHLWMGGGVAGAIKRKGGDEIEREAVSKGPIVVGEAVATVGGKLNVKYVIDAAVMGQDLRTNGEKIGEATRNALKRAEELRLESIEFPALGTGVGEFPIDQAARIMISEAKEFLKHSKSVRNIGFVLFDSDSFESFKKQLNGERLEV